MATWLVVGNAGALVIVFNLLSDGRGPDQSYLKTVATCFVFGLILAFSGASLGYIGGLFALKITTESVGSLDAFLINQHFIDQLESEGINVSEESELRKAVTREGEALTAAKAKVSNLFLVMYITLGLYGASAIAFVGGVLLPVWSMSVATNVIESPIPATLIQDKSAKAAN